MCKTFYLVNFVLFRWIYFIHMVLWDVLLIVICLNKIEIKRYSPRPLWGILILVQLLLILWQYCITISWLKYVQKISKCSWWNFCKTTQSFLFCKVFLNGSAGCSSWSIWFWIFKNSCWKKMPDRNSVHIQEFEITDNWKVPESFQSYLGNLNNKTNLVKYVF